VAYPVTPVRQLLPGLLWALGVAVLATGFGRAVPLLGAPVSAVLIGVALSLLWRRPGSPRDLAPLVPGLRLASSRVLQLGVVALGTQLSLSQAAEVGWRSLPVMLLTLVVCLLAALWVGRTLGVDGELRTLIGVGTAICGASAIAAITPVIRAPATKVAYALSTVFLFNLLAVLLFPAAGHLMGMSDQTFALWAGTAINDTSSVVAAATTFSAAAGREAVVVKLVRTLMLIPISLGLALLVARRDQQRSGATWPPVHRLIPWFLVGFVLMAALNSLGLLGPLAGPVGGDVATFLITVALAAIGLSTDVPALRRAGWRPMVLGGALWAIITVTALLAIAALGPEGL